MSQKFLPISTSTSKILVLGGCTTDLSFFEVGKKFQKNQESHCYSVNKSFPKFGNFFLTWCMFFVTFYVFNMTFLNLCRIWYIFYTGKKKLKFFNTTSYVLYKNTLNYHFRIDYTKVPIHMYCNVNFKLYLFNNNYYFYN